MLRYSAERGAATDALNLPAAGSAADERGRVIARDALNTLRH
jgi:hypothetical protein